MEHPAYTDRPPSAAYDHHGVPVYAVIITGKQDRQPFLHNAVRSFAQQSYPNRYCVIVSDGAYPSGDLGIPEERLIVVRLTEQKVLGELRNEALTQLPSDAVWVQWDDDDWHHPLLMEHQLRTLLENNGDACVLRNQIKISLAKNSAWEDRLPSRYHGFAGSIMMRHLPGIRYPAWSRKEDSAFLRQVLDKGCVISWENPIQFYLRFILPDSTSGSFHFRLLKRRANRWNLDPVSRAYLTEIEPHYQFAGLDASAVPGAAVLQAP